MKVRWSTIQFFIIIIYMFNVNLHKVADLVGAPQNK